MMRIRTLILLFGLAVAGIAVAADLPPLEGFGKLYASDPDGALALAEQHAWLMASEIRASGLDLSFAPVLEAQEDFVELKRQLLSFTGARNQADDGPDALESAISLLRVRSGKASLVAVPSVKRYGV